MTDKPKSYAVRFYKWCKTSDRMSIVVNANSPEEAKQRVKDWGEGNLELTEAEERTETCEKEEVVDAGWEQLDEGYEPVEIDPDPPIKWDVFAARDGETFRAIVDGDDEDDVKATVRPFIRDKFRMEFTNERIAEDPDFFDGELDGFLVEERN